MKSQFSNCLTLISLPNFMNLYYYAIRPIVPRTIFLCLFSLSFSLFAQNQPFCGTDPVHAQHLKDHPGAAVDQELFEQLYQSLAQNRLLAKSSSVNPDDHGSAALKYIVPCVVHVIHNGGVENITDAQVKSAFARINEDFRRMPETKGWGAGPDFQIEFELASKDPQGNAHSGINRIQSALTDHNLDTQQGTLKALSKWDQNKYMNIWIVKSINSSVLAYATFPQNGGNANDGIVCSYYCWGTTGAVDGSRALCRVPVHEFGHWLALYHPFQPSGTSSTGCPANSTTPCTSQGDRVCDTPPVSAANFGNPARRNSCQESSDRPDRTRNYMDYSDDPYKDEFTAGQLVRSQLAMENDNSRKQLYTESNLQATGVGKYRLPEANFVAQNRFPCVGTAVQFVDWSNGQADGWSWSFPGGTPATSNLRNPVVTYAAAGTYDVTLTVTNQTGSSQAFTKTAYINVTDQSVNFPMKEDFNGNDFPPAGWRLHNPDAGVTFVKLTGVSAFGSSGNSARISQFTYRAYDQRDELITPALNLGGSVHPMVYFSLAYTQHSDLYSDTLEVYASDDCGATWNQVFRVGGADLTSNSGPQTSTFTPGATDWIIGNADLSAYAGKTNVRVKFESVNGYGNNLYLDDIEFREPWAVSNELDFIKDAKVVCSPNPFSQSLMLHILSPINEDVEVLMQDVTGRIVWNSGQFSVITGKNEFSLSPAGIAPGVYFVQVKTSAGLTQTIKVVKE